jgi:hypothetical protein
VAEVNFLVKKGLTVPKGSASTPAIIFDASDPNTGIYSPGADQLAISTNGTGRLFVDSSGRVGIGLNAPAGILHMGTANTRAILINNSTIGTANTDGTYLTNSTDGSFSIVNQETSSSFQLRETGDTLFTTSGTERARIDSSGRLLVGTSSARTNLRSGSATVKTQFETTDANGAFVFIQNTTAANPAYLILAKQKSGSAGGNTSVADSDSVGNIEFHANDGTNFIRSASITCAIDGTPGANDMPSRLVFSTTADGAASPTERLRIDSSGRVGIGTTSPANLLSLEFSSASSWTSGENLAGSTNDDVVGLRIYNANSSASAEAGILLTAGDSNTAQYTISCLKTGSNTGDFVFRRRNGATGSLEAARLDSSGRLLVGTSSARSNFYNGTGTAQIQVEGTNFNNSSISITNNSLTDADAGAFILNKSGGASIGSNTLVASGETIGSIAFNGNDGTEFVSCAIIQALVDGTPGANDMPGRLVFSTTADGAASPTERVRINGGGNIALGGGSPGTQGTLSVFPNYSTGSGTFIATTPMAYWNRVNSASLGTACLFENGGFTVGTITYTDTTTAYNTSSDYRLKENIVPLTGAADRLNQLQVHRFNFIADPDTTVDGFIAHEAQAVVPECVTGTKDEVDDEGNPVYQGIDQSKLVPLLTAALQEAIGRIETLEAEVAALKGS